VELSAPAPLASGPSFDNLIALKPQEEKEETKYEDTPPLFPPIVTDAILPLVISLICFVWIGVMLVPRALHSGSPVTAFVLMGFALGLYILVTLPLSLRAVEGAAKASDYELPNAVGLQTFSAIAIPTAAMVFGYFAGGITGVFMALIVGCALMSLLMAVLYGAHVSGAVLTGLFASMWYAIGNVAVVAGCAIVAFFMAAGHLAMPWDGQAPAPTAAAMGPSATPPPSTAPLVISTQPAPVEQPKPVVVETPAPPQPPTTQSQKEEPTAPKWIATADPGAPADQKGTPLLHQIIEIKPGATVVHSTPPGPFIAVVDQEFTIVHDIRNGRRMGAIKERLQPRSIVLHPAGTYLAGVPMIEAAPMNPGAMPVATVAAQTVVFNVADARPVARIANTGFAPVGSLARLWFVGSDTLVNFGRDEKGSALAIRELKLALPPRSIALDANGESAFSPGGRFLASINGQKLSLVNVENGSVAGESALPRRYSAIRGLLFSPDGTLLVALLDEGMSGWHIISWNTWTGEVVADRPVVVNQAIWSPESFQFLSDSKGVLIGDDLVDVGSGKVFYTFEHPVAGTSTGHVMRVNWPDQAVYEYPAAPGGSKVIYKSAPLPRADIEVALRALRPATTMPSTMPTTAPTLASAQLPAATRPTTAPATQRMSLVSIVKQKEWTVDVIAVVGVDIEALNAEAAAQQQKLTQADARVAAAKAQLNKVSSEFTIQTVVDRFGNARQQNVYNDAAIAQASSDLRKVTDEQRTIKQALARLDREKSTAKSKRTITGRLADTTLCQIDVDTQPMAVVADTMAAGGRYVIAGLAQVTEGVVHIKPRTITPAP
jgi:hypothetical protein